VDFPIVQDVFIHILFFMAGIQINEIG